MLIVGRLFDDIVIYFPGTVDPTIQISLLPRSLRRKVLLLLPAVDVCRLEGTSATNGIAMEEIWEELFKERMPCCNKEKLLQCGLMFYTPADFMEEMSIHCSWKEAYFNAVFMFWQAWSQFDLDIIPECGCVYSHFIPDLLFGVYSFDHDIELYRCFNTKETFSVQNVCRCVQNCSRLTPSRYYSKFESPSIPERESDGSGIVSASTLLEVLVDVARVNLPHVLVSTVHFKSLWENDYLKDYVEKLSKLLSKVKSVDVFRLPNGEELKNARVVFDLIFNKNCQVKCLSIDDTPFLPLYYRPVEEKVSVIHVVFPYLSNCQLEHLAVDLDVDSKYEEKMCQILESHSSLQTLEFNLSKAEASKSLQLNKFFKSVADLLHQPLFKKLEFDCHRLHGGISPEILFILFRQFFSSPNCISLSLSLKCPNFDGLNLPFVTNLNENSKSLEFNSCSFSPNLASLLPTNLVLKSLDLNCADYNTLCSFASLESINVENICVDFHNFITETNIDVMCSLFRIVTAQSWKLAFSIDEVELESPVESCLANGFTRIASSLESLRFYYFVSLPVLETVFQSMSPSKLKNLQLSFTLFNLKKDDVKAIHALWKTHGAIKLKKIQLFDKQATEEVPLLSLLSDMTLELKIC